MNIKSIVYNFWNCYILVEVYLKKAIVVDWWICYHKLLNWLTSNSFFGLVFTITKIKSRRHSFLNYIFLCILLGYLYYWYCNGLIINCSPYGCCLDQVSLWACSSCSKIFYIKLGWRLLQFYQLKIWWRWALYHFVRLDWTVKWACCEIIEINWILLTKCKF